MMTVLAVLLNVELTTKTSPKLFSNVHSTLYPSFSNPSFSPRACPSMKASLIRALTGEAGVRARAEKAGVKERDQRMRPPSDTNQLRRAMTLLTYSGGI